MNTDSFSIQEKLLIIQSLNHRLVENYELPSVVEKKRIFNKNIKPIHTALEKLTEQNEKLTKDECNMLRSSIHSMKTKVSPEKSEVLNKCYKRLKTS